MAMTVGEQMPLADVKTGSRRSWTAWSASTAGSSSPSVDIQAAVVISMEDLESLEETLNVMDSEALLADIREALAELAAAPAPVLSKDEALRLIQRP